MERDNRVRGTVERFIYSGIRGCNEDENERMHENVKYLLTRKYKY